MTKDADIVVAPIKIVLNIVSPPGAIIVPTNVGVFLNDVLVIHARLAKTERKTFFGFSAETWTTNRISHPFGWG